MKVLLINPPTGIYDRADRCQAPIEEEGIEMVRPPMDLAYLAAMVEKAGQKAIIRDYPAEKMNWSNFEKDLLDNDPDMLIISTTTPTLEKDLITSKIAKKKNKNIITMAKGAYFNEFDKKVLKKFNDLDLVIRGEGEETLFEIIKGKKISDIKGITYRNGKTIVRNEDRPFIKNLDDLPFPARHLLKKDLYVFPDTNEPYALIQSSKGCFGNCIFCLVGEVSGKIIRTRSVENIILEIEDCIKNFKIKTFFFRADTFTWRKDWVVHFCNEILKRNLRIRWGTNSRVDTLDEETIVLMKKSGCDIIGFGIESGNQYILEKMKKGITLEQAKKVVNLCYKHKIKTLLFFIIGLPWEDKEKIQDTINFAKSLPGTFYNFSLAYPFPGTEYYSFVIKNKLLLKKSLLGYNYSKPATKTFYLTNKELENLRKKALASIYYRPSYIWRVLNQTLSGRQLFNYLRFGFIKTIKLISNENTAD